MICPIASGALSLKLDQGFLEFRRLGPVEGRPRLFGCQAEESAPVAAAFADGGNVQPVRPATASQLGQSDRVVLLITGDGLKTPEHVAGRCQPIEIEPDADRVLERLAAA